MRDGWVRPRDRELEARRRLRALASILGATIIALCSSCGASVKGVKATGDSVTPTPRIGPATTTAHAPTPDVRDEGSSAAGAELVVRVSPTTARVPGLLSALSEMAAKLNVVRDGAELQLRGELHDEPGAPAVYSAQRPGISVSGGPERLEFVWRSSNWARGGEVPNPPPLAAIWVLTLRGLEPAQLVSMVMLAVHAMLEEEATSSESSAAASGTKAALARASSVLADPRASANCQTPCQRWPWQTRWSVLTTYARAEWREAVRTGDEALLKQSARRVRQALDLVPKQNRPLTTAVSERLLGAVLDAVWRLNHAEAVLTESLASSRRALQGFQDPAYRYDWAFTMQNLQRTLEDSLVRTASQRALDEPLVASEKVLSVIDQQTPALWVQALLRRAQLLQQRWTRSEDPRELTEAAELLEKAAGVRAAIPETLAIELALERCDILSQLAASRGDVEALRRAVALGESTLKRASLPASYEWAAHRAYGVALGRLGWAMGDVPLLEKAVEQLEAAVEVADRIGVKGPRVATRASYASALEDLSGFTGNVDTLSKATAVSTEALSLISKQASLLWWGQLKQLEGNELLALGWRERADMQLKSAIRFYQESRAAFAEAQGVFSKKETPKRWARLQEQMGLAFAREAESDGRRTLPLINQAIGAYEGALTVNRRPEDPIAFAGTQFGLGITYLIWAERSRSHQQVRDAAKHAVNAFRTALGIYQEAGIVASAAHSKAHLADATDRLELAKGAKTCEALRLRVEAVREFPLAGGLWSPVAVTLERYDRSRFDRNLCAKVHPSFWEGAPKRAHTP